DDRLLRINQLSLRGMPAHDLHYTALKTVYLVVRHQLTFGEDVATLMRTPITLSPFLTKHLIGLMRELCLCMTRHEADRSLLCLENTLGVADATRLAREYL